MNIKRKGFTILMWCSVVLCFVSVAIFLTLNITWIMVFWSHQAISGVSHSALMRDYQRLLVFLQLPGTGKLNFTSIPMSMSGRQHFTDVKGLMMLNEVVMVISGTVALRYLYGEKKKHQLWQLMLPMKGLAVLIPVLVAMLMVNFNELFIRFHELVFPNTDWVFNPVTDPIIDVLTENFFAGCVLIFMVVLEGLIGTVYWLGKSQLRINR